MRMRYRNARSPGVRSPDARSPSPRRRARRNRRALALALGRCCAGRGGNRRHRERRPVVRVADPPADGQQAGEQAVVQRWLVGEHVQRRRVRAPHLQARSRHRALARHGRADRPARPSSRADALWDAARGKLYIASHVYTTSGRRAGKGNSGRVYRYSYNGVTGTYALDPGFPVVINAAKSETLVIDEDSTGMLWATWTRAGASTSTTPSAATTPCGSRRTSFPAPAQRSAATTSPR